MATVLQIKQDNNDLIRAKTAPSSILRTDDANLRDGVANELRDRGMLEAASTGAMASISKDDTRKVLVKNVGVFQILTTGDAANGTTTFASADVGYLWEKVISNTVSASDPEEITTGADYDYVLGDGLMIDIIMVKPTTGYTLKIGLTDGGEEVMISTALTANKWNKVFFMIDADGAPVTVYFVGISSSSQICIYKRALP